MTIFQKITSVLYELEEQDLKKVYRFARILLLESEYADILQKKNSSDIFLDMSNLELFELEEEKFEKMLYEKDWYYTSQMKSILDFNQGVLELSQRRVQLNTAISMLKDNLDIPSISKHTKLSIKALENLQKNTSVSVSNLLILDNLEYGCSKEDILQKIQRKFGFTEEQAEQYFEERNK